MGGGAGAHMAHLHFNFLTLFAFAFMTLKSSRTARVYITFVGVNTTNQNCKYDCK